MKKIYVRARDDQTLYWSIKPDVKWPNLLCELSLDESYFDLLNLPIFPLSYFPVESIVRSNMFCRWMMFEHSDQL